MDYEKTAPFDGDFDKVTNLAISVFTPFGFSITERTDSGVEFAGANLWLTSQNPFIAISRIRFASTGTQMTVSAELKGLQRLFGIIGWILLGMAMAFVLSFGFLLRGGDVVTRFVVPVLPFVPWVVLFPVLKHVIRSRTRQALDVLLQNFVIAGRR